VEAERPVAIEGEPGLVAAGRGLQQRHLAPLPLRLGPITASEDCIPLSKRSSSVKASTTACRLLTDDSTVIGSSRRSWRRMCSRTS
jgi:hypothetical protein